MKTSSKRAQSPEGLLVDPEKPWYLVKIKEAWESTGPRPEAAHEVSGLYAQAEAVYLEQVAAFGKDRDISKSDRDWLKTVGTAGTASDKASAFLLQIQEAPIYSGDFLKRLLEMARSTSRHESSLAISSLLEAFKLLLPPAGLRKLLYLKQRKWTSPSSLTRRTLMVCYFEEIVKRGFFEFLKILEIALQDQIAHVRATALRVAYQLSLDKDEQLVNMMTMIVNKLGDPDKKISSRVIFYLQQILSKQPVHKGTIIKLVEQLVFRPGINQRSQYYGVNFLAQVMLSHGESAVCEALMKTYLAILKDIVLPSLSREATTTKAQNRKKAKLKGAKKRLGQVDEEAIHPRLSKLAKIVALGISRAVPYYKGDTDLLAALDQPLQVLLKGRSLACALQAFNVYYLVVSAAVEAKSGLNAALADHTMALLSRREILRERSCYPQLMALMYRILCSEQLPMADAEKILKSLIGLCFKVGESALTMAIMLLLSELIALKPSLKVLINLATEAQAKGTLDHYCSGNLWELSVLVYHYIPDVAKAAKAILEGKSLEPAANPFENIVVQQFLKDLTIQPIAL